MVLHLGGSGAFCHHWGCSSSEAILFRITEFFIHLFICSFIHSFVLPSIHPSLHPSTGSFQKTYRGSSRPSTHSAGAGDSAQSAHAALRSLPLLGILVRGHTSHGQSEDGGRRAVSAEILSAQKAMGPIPSWGGPGRTTQGCSQVWGTFQQGPSGGGRWPGRGMTGC